MSASDLPDDPQVAPPGDGDDERRRPEGAPAPPAPWPAVAERRSTYVRLGIALFAAVAYGVWGVPVEHTPALAWAGIAGAVFYSLLLLVWDPFERYDFLTSAWTVTITDAFLITVFILATGGWESPWFPFWYLSIFALSLRFGSDETLMAATGYMVIYGGIGVWEGALPDAAGVFVVRMGFLYAIAALGALLSELLAEEYAERRQVEDLARRRTYELSLLESVLDSTEEGILVVGPDGEIVEWNDRFQEMWGLPDDVLEDRDDDAALAHVLDQLEDPDAFLDRIRELYDHPRETSFDVLRFRDGRVFERFSRPQTLDGEVVGRVWTFRDVTDRVELEEDLRERERRLREAQEVAQVGSWEWDVPSDTVKMSDQQFELLGLDPDAVETHTYEDFLQAVHPDDRERVDALVQEAFETGEYPSFEFRVQYDDGSVRWMENRGNVETGDGEVQRMWGTNLDITERVLPLRRYQSLVQASPDAIVQADEDGRIIGWNQGAEEIFGWNEEEILGEPLTLIMPEGYWGAHRKGLERVLETDEAGVLGETVELEGLRADGTVFPIELSLDSYSAGDQRFFSAIIRDVTDRKEAEDALEDQARRLRRKNEELEEFAYVVSHDLKTPLQGIRHLVDWLEDDLEDVPGDVDDHLDRLDDRATRMHDMIEDLLEMARLSRDESYPEEEVDIEAVLQEVEEVVDPPEGFTVEAEGDLPAIHAPRALFRQVLQNLVDNAVKHHDAEKGTVTVDAATRDGEVVVSVTDDGPGIPEDFRGKVFEPFQSLAPPEEAEGTGAGMAIVRRIVEGRGGEVEIESEGARGTTVRFTWPEGHGSP